MIFRKKMHKFPFSSYELIFFTYRLTYVEDGSKKWGGQMIVRPPISKKWGGPSPPLVTPMGRIYIYFKIRVTIYLSLACILGCIFYLVHKINAVLLIQITYFFYDWRDIACIIIPFSCNKYVMAGTSVIHI